MKTRAVLMLVAVAFLITGPSVHAETVTVDSVSSAIASAKTPAEHEAIATYFKEQAADARKRAEAHKAMLKSYERFGSGKEQWKHDSHCKDAIRSYESLAKDYDALSAEHEHLAQSAAAK